MTSPGASGRHLSDLEKRPKMPHPTALFALNIMQCRGRLQNFRAKHFDNAFELSGVAFRLAVPDGGLFVLTCMG